MNKIEKLNNNKTVISQNDSLTDYSKFLVEIKDRIRRSQYEAAKAVNQKIIQLYWDIGRSITEKQQTLGWGKSVVETLAEDLQREFSGMSGFSARNIWYMQQFYTEYKDNAILQPLVAEISWSKHLVIMSKCKDMQERQFYILSTKKFGWTKDVLIHQVEIKTYERYLLGQTNFDDTLPEKIKKQAVLAVKDEYNFDFLELANEHSEAELEQALLKNICAFLIEFGADFSFIGNQYRIEVESEEYFIDLLLFHRKLQCLVAVELKIGKFIPEYKGKMEFYLNLLNDRVKLPHENEAIGIIVCKSKKRTIVEYALKDSKKPIGVATYSLSATLPEAYKALLPSPTEIAEKMEPLLLY
ncbi:MAG: PDDEXK nuclease domain-containing protein [Bacteroidales bacterium]|nr:PDDEXK nuclease domain-containing protein [Bacteroidales bacterium]